MVVKLDLEVLRAAVDEQRAMVFQNASHTQYGVAIACPQCEQTTRWVEEHKDRQFLMQPCGHKMPSNARQIEVDGDGYLRVKQED